MMTERPKFLAYAQLLRLPNAFTAMADPLAGWFAVGGGVPSWELPLVVVASACFYTAGAVLNDCFDYKLDCVEHSERPLPSSAVSLKTAWILGATLMVGGLALAGLAGPVPFGVGSFLAAMILFYNAWARRFPVLRPLVLGSCHFASFLLGMRCIPSPLMWMPSVVGLCATLMAYISMRTTENAGRQTITKRLLLGMIVVDAAIVLLSPFGDWMGTLLVLSLLVPAFALAKVSA